MSIAGNLLAIKATIPNGVTLVAITKTQGVEAIMEAYRAGHRVFGENRVQELVEKYDRLPRDIEWHLVGHLQTNKVRHIAPFIGLIHSVDSPKLLQEIDKEGRKCGRAIRCLLQVHIATEETKFGLTAEELLALATRYANGGYPNVSVRGLMGMATFTPNAQQVSGEFAALARLFGQLKSGVLQGDEQFQELSMGMSDDYPLALAQGSTMVRVGSRIFGARC